VRILDSSKKIIPFLLLALLSVTLIYESMADTPTYDEPANMAASYAYVYRNDYRLYPDNPPLVKILAGLSLLPIAGKMNFPSQLPIYNDPTQFDLYKFGTEFLYRSGNPTREIIFLSRLPNIIITVLLGLSLYLIATKLYGPKAGLLALFLFSFDPNIRGHGHILAFDIPLAFLSLLAFYLIYQFIKLPEKRGLFGLLLAFAFAAGYLTKFTFIFVALILIVYALWSVIKLDNNKIKNSFFLLIVTCLMPFFLLWFFAISTNYHKITLDYDKLPIIASANKLYKNNSTWNLISKLPVPYFYKAGMLTMYTHNNTIGQPPAFLLGEVRPQNDWFFYFPVSFLLKTPIPTLLLIFFSIYLVLSKWRQMKIPSRHPGSHDEIGTGCANALLRGGGISITAVFPFLFALYFMFMLMLFSHINNVYRYLFPSLIFFILGASQIVNYINLNILINKLFFFFVICYLSLTSYFSFPLDLSYTNELTGIPPKGYRYLSDSEVDWGQDLERLAIWLKQNKLDKETVTLSYLGTADPQYYGINSKPLQFDSLDKLSGIVVISVGNLTLGDWQWTSQPEYKARLTTAPLDFLRNRKPDAVIGKSIFVFKFDSNK